jgi:hypothetical protein
MVFLDPDNASLSFTTWSLFLSDADSPIVFTNHLSVYPASFTCSVSLSLKNLSDSVVSSPPPSELDSPSPFELRHHTFSPIKAHLLSMDTFETLLTTDVFLAYSPVEIALHTPLILDYILTSTFSIPPQEGSDPSSLEIIPTFKPEEEGEKGVELSMTKFRPRTM